MAQSDKKRIKELEEKLSYYESSKAQARLYRGLIKQVNDISKLFEKLTVSEDDLRNKDDKFFERYFKYLEKVEAVNKGLKGLENSIIPEKDEEQESGSLFEEAQKHNGESSRS